MSVCVSPTLATPLMVEELPCPQCPKAFPNAKLLQQHQQMFHSDKSFICETCGKAFRFRSNLAEHRSVHTALKPYVCKFCGKSSRLKGNLTKHILKHHKKEQSEAISKDDIIVKKAEPTTATIEYTDKTIFTVTTAPSGATTIATNGHSVPSLLPKEESGDQERSILISLGLDYNTSIDLRESPETSVSPENGLMNPKCEVDSDQGYGSPLAQNTVGGETSLAALIAQVNSPTCGKNSMASQCPECGKHVRKSSYLPIHMTLHHGYPPPESVVSSDDKISEEADGNSGSDDGALQGELRAIANAICDLKAQQQTFPKVETALSSIETRISRLEKNMETALNSIYTLVQLQTGMNSGLNRFKEEANQQLSLIKSYLELDRQSP